MFCSDELGLLVARGVKERTRLLEEKEKEVLAAVKTADDKNRRMGKVTETTHATHVHVLRETIEEKTATIEDHTAVE